MLDRAASPGAAADRANRRRQDAGGLPAHAWPNWPTGRTRACTRFMSRRSRHWRPTSSATSARRLPRWACRSGSRIAPATPAATQKKRQRADPPHILLTTPESLALLISYEDAPRMFAGLQRVIVDEIHALAESKRGDQLMLALARLQTLCPTLRRVGLSATVEDPAGAGASAGPTSRSLPDPAWPIPAPIPTSPCWTSTRRPPWSGGGAKYAIPAVLEQVKQHRTTLIFHNTRAQAEIFFHNLWLANDDDLPIGIHHGSLAREQRERVEAAMVDGELARHRLHRLARSGHRLGRRRSGDPGRRAEERQAPDPAHRARQPPLQRAVQGAAGARQPVRGGRMRRRAGGRAANTNWTATRAAPARATCCASIS